MSRSFSAARGAGLLFSLLYAAAGQAATPASGTLTDTSGPIVYTAGPFSQPNPSPVGTDAGPRCNANFPCDSYALTVTLPADYATRHPNGTIRVSTG